MLLSQALLPFDPLAVRDLCAELDHWKTRLDSKGTLLRSWEGRLRRDLEAEAVAASTSMEGVPVTVEEVRRILAGDKPAEVSAADRDLVEGYRQAMGYVLRRADDPNFRWDRELLVGLHDRVLAGHHGAGAGRLRTETRNVANSGTGRIVFETPDPSEVPRLVDLMCQVLQVGFEHPAMAAAWVHVATAAIHPFADGNGRSARVLASLAMYRGGFRRREFTSLEEWWGRHLADYYAAFSCLGSRFQAVTDVTPFVQAHVRAQLGQVRALEMRERILRRIYAGMLAVLESEGLDPRMVNALWDAFFGTPLTAGYYASVSDVSPATATNDLAKGVAAGLLRAEGERRGRRYLAGGRLYQRLGEVLGVDLSGPHEQARRFIIAELADRIHAMDMDRARRVQESDDLS